MIYTALAMSLYDANERMAQIKLSKHFKFKGLKYL